MIPPATILLAIAIGFALLGAWNGAAAFIRHLRVRRRLRMIIEDNAQHARSAGLAELPWPLAGGGPEDRVILGARGGHWVSHHIHPSGDPASRFGRERNNR